MTPRAEVVWATDNALVIRLQWRHQEASDDREMFQVLRMGDHSIEEMADYRTVAEATKAAIRFGQGDD